MANFYKFAEEAIELAGKAGERKRKYGKEMETMLAKSRMAELKKKEAGLAERQTVTEAGLGERLGREQEFARPGQAAEIRRLKALGGLRGAEAEEVRYGTEFARGARGTLEGILESRRKLAGVEAEEAELGLSEAEREIKRRDEAGIRATAKAEAEAEVERPPIPARPERRMRPGLKRALWTGWPERGLPGLGAPIKGYLDIAEMLGRGARKGYEWAFPRGK